MQVVSVVLAAAAVGALLGGATADFLGRRRGILLCAGVFCAGAGAMALAPDFAVLLLGRACVGLAIGASGMVVSVYMSEISPPHLRGPLVAVNEFAVCTGCLVALLVSAGLQDTGAADAWRWSLGLSAVPAALQLMGASLLPVSPHWLAVRALHACCDGGLLSGMALTGPGDDGVAAQPGCPDTPTPRPEDRWEALPPEQELAGVVAGFLRSQHGNEATRQSSAGSCLAELSRTWKELRATLDVPGGRFALGLAVSAAVTQNLAFSNAMLYYARPIFEAGGITSSWLPSVGVGLAKFAGVAIALPLLARLPRRLLLGAGMVTQVAACVAMAAAFTALPAESPGLQAAVTVGMLVFILAWDCSWAPGMWVVCSELLPTRSRGTGMGLAVAAFWATSAVANQTVLSIAEATSWSAFMVIVAVLTTFATGFVVAVLPETQGKSLEE
ncbi:ywtG, partial [Symbiodinium sp. KB8]